MALAREYIGLPVTPVLGQNYPNPFNASTAIRLVLPRTEEVEIAVYNLKGQKVTVLADGVLEPGTYTLFWNGRDAEGRQLASGVYPYRLQTGDRMETRKMVLLE